MFSRVVEAMAKGAYSGRLLLLSAGIVAVLAGSALIAFSMAASVVQSVFYPAYPSARNLLLLAGLIGAALSLNSLLVQFLMAADEPSFMYLLGIGCVVQAMLIKLNHGDLGAILIDVLGTLILLLVVLSIRCWLLLPKLHSLS